MELVSAGPDKQRGTSADFVALTIERSWFGNFEAIIRRALAKSQDYPATQKEFQQILANEGIALAAVRDPWGTPLRAVVETLGADRMIRILSAGPDKVFNTPDDDAVANNVGRYFQSTEQSIEAALAKVNRTPESQEQFRTALAAGGFDFDALRDALGYPYYLSFRTEQAYRDDVQVYSYSEYKGVSEQRENITPTKHTLRIIEIRSMGPDTIKGTYDDFAIATIVHDLNAAAAKTPTVETSSTPAFAIPGKGTITGVVSDASGAPIPHAAVVLDNQCRTQSDETGRYWSNGVLARMGELRFESPGFQMRVIERVPIVPDRVTRVDTALQVGSMSQSVEVGAVPPPPVQTAGLSQSETAAQQQISTPRVREYFPETLYWAPELVTTPDGHASIKVKFSRLDYHLARASDRIDCGWEDQRVR